jgi:hypothetical protein
VEVHNTIEPSTVDSSHTVQWKVDVHNKLSEDIVIERCVVSEKATEGWAVGSYEFQDELAITNTVIAAGATETIYQKAKAVANSGPNQIEITNTVTVYIQAGGSCAGTCTYQIHPR